MAALHSGYQTLFQLSISASETTPEFTGFKQNRYFLKIVQSELDSAGHFFWSHLGSFVPLQTCKDSSGTGHQRRFHSHVWYLGWSGWNSWGTVGNLCLGSLSGRVAGPFSMTARGSTREEAEACRPQENCNGTTVSKRVLAPAPDPRANILRLLVVTRNAWPIFSTPQVPPEEQRDWQHLNRDDRNQRPV